MNVSDTVKDILTEDLFVEVPPHEMQPQDSLRDVFGLDSVGFVELRVQCEVRFGVKIGDDLFTPENFTSLATVCDLVERLRSAPAPSA